MRVETTAADLRAALAAFRAAGYRIAFVPTMGNLHAGHLRLVEEARREADCVVVSLFVNPTQFGPAEDFAVYPRTPDADIEALRVARADVVFTPSEAVIYPGGSAGSTRVTVPALDDILCGAFRPGHFSGVATVVLSLFNLVQPEVAVFGRKDLQQLRVIERMVRDLNVTVRIVGVDTVREADGLALSSRNARLTADERTKAPLLYGALCEAAHRIAAGERDGSAIEATGRAGLVAAGFRVEYFALRDAHDLAVPGAATREYAVLAAAWLGSVRLIDNVCVRSGNG